MQLSRGHTESTACFYLGVVNMLVNCKTIEEGDSSAGSSAHRNILADFSW